MQASRALRRLSERVPWSKHEFWLTLVRLIIVLGVVAAAVRLLAIAYSPQSSAMPQQSCPSDVGPYREPVVSMPALPSAAQSATCVMGDAVVFGTTNLGIVDDQDRRGLNANEKSKRSETRKPPTLSRNEISRKRTPMGEPIKRSVTPANQRTWEAPRAMLAKSPMVPSPFGEMHGQ